MESSKAIGLPLTKNLEDAIDLPHTISFAVTYRERINSFRELPKEKQPPRNLWDKPYKLSLFLDSIFEVKGGPKKTDYIEFDTEDVE